MKSFTFVFVWLLMVIIGGYGWVWNIIDLIHMHDGITGLFVVRVVGIFVAPIGAVLGFVW